MSWFKRQQPILLCQSSEIPYVILENGVYLCFDNCYEEKSSDSAHRISFNTAKNQLSRISTNYYRFRHFPTIVPFEDIIYLDDAVIEGKTIKHANISHEDSSIKVIVVVSDYLDQSDEQSFNQLIDEMDTSACTMILTGESTSPKTRLFEDMANIIYHQDWYRTNVQMADVICKLSHRKYCWTHSLPPMNVHYYGLSSGDDSDKINEVLNNIGVPHFSVIWED